MKNKLILFLSLIFLILYTINIISAQPSGSLSIKSIQNGTLTLGTNPTNVGINSVNMSQTFTICYWGTTSSNANQAVTCNLTSSTNLRVQAGIAGAAIVVSWFAVEFESGASVQRGNTSWATATASQNITISSVNLTKTFVIVGTNTTSTSQTIDEQRITRAVLTNSTNLQLIRVETGIAVNTFWQVVELNNVTVQNGTTTLSSAASATASINSVNTSDTFLVFSTSGAAATNGVDAEYYVRGRFVDPTTINFSRASATNSATVSWFAVSVDGAKVQNGTSTAATTQVNLYSVLNAINLSRASAFLSSNGGTTGTADQDSLTWKAMFPNSTAINVSRQSTQSLLSNVDWFVIEWPVAAAPGPDSCTCTDGASWTIINGDQCTLSTTCNLGANPLRIWDGALRITSSGSLNAQGCYIQNAESLYVISGGKLICR